MQYLFVAVLAFAVMISGMLIKTSKFERSAPVASKSGAGKFGPYCLSRDELDTIIKGPTAFTCDGREYVLAAENVQVDRIFIHAEKKLIIKKTCNNTTYYSWFCHPPSYGSLWNNTLWKLKPDPEGTIKDGDLFDVYLVKDPDENAAFICNASSSDATGEAIYPLISSPEEIKTININNIQAEWLMSSETVSPLDIESVPIRHKIATISLKYSNGEEREFDAWANLLKAFSPDEETAIYLVEKGLLSLTNTNIPGKVAYKKYQIKLIIPTTGGKNSLQLKTFKPVIPPPPDWLKVYLPESKPVVYLYPEQKLRVHVEVKPVDGKITISDPTYSAAGWEVVADKNSSIQAGNATYPYLYYETEVAGYNIPKEGFVLEKENSWEKLSEIVTKLGLNAKETAQFTSYWQERFDHDVKTKYLFVGIIPQEELDNIVPLKITPEPQLTIRVRLYFKPIEGFFDVNPPSFLNIPKRVGFTAVEWGGILDK